MILEKVLIEDGCQMVMLAVGLKIDGDRVSCPIVLDWFRVGDILSLYPQIGPHIILSGTHPLDRFKPPDDQQPNPGASFRLIDVSTDNTTECNDV